MNPIKDISNQRFGKLVAIRTEKSSDIGKRIWVCVCDCGNTTEVLSDSLRRGNTRSCGCTNRTNLVNRNTTHGLSKSRLYHIWRRMKQRCNDANTKDYANYGGRGITICNEWKDDFLSFHDWATKNGYDADKSIDRIDVNGNYEPGNCRWADMKEQASNKRNNRKISYKGETHTLAEWSRITGIDTSLIRYRLKRHMELSKVLTK